MLDGNIEYFSLFSHVLEMITAIESTVRNTLHALNHSPRDEVATYVCQPQRELCKCCAEDEDEDDELPLATIAMYVPVVWGT